MQVASAPCVVKHLGRAEYLPTAAAMRAFTERRDAGTADELWIVEHPPVYTLGVGADAAHGPKGETRIPVLRCERGGDITYHGPGQVVLYVLLDLARRGIRVREFVSLLEQSVIDLLAEHGVAAGRHSGAPGVYVAGAKVAALGLRVSRGRCYHGVSLNVDMDLAPFAAIDPCGFPGLRVTQTRALGIDAPPAALGLHLAAIVMRKLDDA
ncbi:MAG: lipoyl(octanoyl) transferase LipB [Betaproteobacteria bacterium]|nr:MAG: lipoyl(octanoyl) transferase LipB [Betaproteobacteria bacterium]